MSIRKHTPTPWVATPGRRTIAISTPRNGSWREIATVPCTSGTDETNAAHIVKCVNAHDPMMDALGKLVDVYGTIGFLIGKPGEATPVEVMQAMGECVIVARAALKLARGEA